MQHQRGYKLALDLNNKQATLARKHAGAARWAYNWGLSRKKAAYAAGVLTPSAIDLHRSLNALKKTELPWMYEVSKCAPQEALRDRDKAFAHFFRKCALKKAGKWTGKCGYPSFKSRKRAIGGARLLGAIHIYEDAIQLPRLGLLRLKECGYLPAGAKVGSATISEQAGRWYVSVVLQTDVPEPAPATGDAIGVDLGIKAMAVCSDGVSFDSPKALRRNLTALRRCSRAHSPKLKGSRNRAKAKHKLARMHARIAIYGGTLCTKLRRQ